jgi:hypothetical protein
VLALFFADFSCETSRASSAGGFGWLGLSDALLDMVETKLGWGRTLWLNF